jgi:hypothetical protein
VSDKGRVYSESNGGSQACLMSTPKQTKGYPHVGLCKNGSQQKKTVHDLVMAAHGPEKPSEDAFINHKNADKTDNRLENLEWVSPLENRLHGAMMEYIDRHGASALIDRIYEWL